MHKRITRNQSYEAALAQAFIPKKNHRFRKWVANQKHPLELAVAMHNLTARVQNDEDYLSDLIHSPQHAYQLSIGLGELQNADIRLQYFERVKLNLLQRYSKVLIDHPEHALELARGITGYYFCEKEEPLPEQFLELMLQNGKHADSIGSTIGRLYAIHRQRLAKANQAEGINIIKARERELFSKRLSRLMADPASAYTVAQSLDYLEQGYLPLHLEPTMIHARKHAHSLLDGLHYLVEANLTRYCQLLYDNPEFAVQLVSAIKTLLSNKLEHCMIYLTAYPQYAVSIANGLATLKQHALMRYQDTILKHPEHASTLARTLVELENNPLLRPYRHHILHSPEYASGLATAITTLHACGMSHHIPELILHPESAFSIAYGAEALHRANLLQEFEPQLMTLDSNLAKAIIFCKQNQLDAYIPSLLKHPQGAYGVMDMMQLFIKNPANILVLQNLPNKDKAIEFLDYAFMRICADMHFLVFQADEERYANIMAACIQVCSPRSLLNQHMLFRNEAVKKISITEQSQANTELRHSI